MLNRSHTLAPPLRLGLNDGTLGLLAAAILLLCAAIWAARLPGVEKTDFSLTYVGAKIVYSGLGHRLYDTEFQKQTRDSLFQHPNPLFFEHPPFEALLLSPLAALPFRVAYLLWGISNAAIWILLIIFLRPHLPWPSDNLGYICLWLLFAPLAVALYQGQSSIMLLAVFAITFGQLKRQREFAAGAALGLGLIKFQFVLPLALIFLLVRNWRVLSGFMTSSCLLAILSMATVGMSGIKQYFEFLLTIARNPQNLSYGSAVDMPTIQGFLYATVGGKISHAWLTIVSAFLSLLLLVWTGHHLKSSKSEASLDLVFAAAVSAALLSGSHMFTHDFSPLILAMFLAAAHLREAPSGLRIATSFTLGVFWTFPIYFLLVANHSLYLMCLVLLLFVYATLQLSSHGVRPKFAEIECVRA